MDELGRIAGEEALTILLTTHYLEEADRLANRLAIVSRGHVVVEGTPKELKQSLEGDCRHRRALGREHARSAGHHREPGRHPRGARGGTATAQPRRPRRARHPAIFSALDRGGIAVEAVDSHRPSLDDVYLHYTGRDFREEDEAVAE